MVGSVPAWGYPANLFVNYICAAGYRIYFQL